MGTCWFCEKGVSVDDSAFVVQLERGQGSRREERALVIPRCPQCKKEHDGSAPEIYGLAGGTGCGCLLALMIGISIAAGVRQAFGAGPGLGLLVTAGIAVAGAALGGMGGYRAVAYFKPGGRRGKVKPQSAHRKHPDVTRLQQEGWEPVVLSGTQQLAPWQKQCASPEKMYAKDRPDACPVCGSNLKTSVASTVGSLTVGSDIATAVRCAQCGAWGCTTCAHNHYGNRAANTYTGEDSGSGQGPASFVHWPNVEWVHDCCCGCSDQWVQHRQQARPKWAPRN